MYPVMFNKYRANPFVRKRIGNKTDYMVKLHKQAIRTDQAGTIDRLQTSL